MRKQEGVGMGRDRRDGERRGNTNGERDRREGMMGRDRREGGEIQ